MFNVSPDTGLPGFRVNLPEDQPGFRIDKNGWASRAYASTPNAPALGHDFSPAGLFYNTSSGLYPTTYRVP